MNTTITLDSDLNKQVNTDQCSTAASISERSTTLPVKSKPLLFYRNLIEEVRREKSEEKARIKEGVGSDIDDGELPSAKKVYHKSKSDFVPQSHGKKEVEQSMAGNLNKPVNMVINNVFQIGSPEQMNYADDKLVQTSALDVNEVNHSFINRFKNPGQCRDSNVNVKNQLEELPFRHLIFNKEFLLSKKEFIIHLKKIQKGLQYAKYLIKPPEQSKVSAKAVPLEKLDEGMKTLVLDLDGTLVHIAENVDNSHVVLDMDIGDGVTKTFGIRFRPYLYHFLEKVSKKYEIIVFTAGRAQYAATVVDYIDPERKYIKYVLSRDRCLVTKNGFFIKDLRILSNRDLNDVLIVDNLTHSFCLQIENGIPILDYQNDANDKELKYLAKYLLKCAESKNPQEFNSQSLRLRELIDVELSYIGQKP